MPRILVIVLVLIAGLVLARSLSRHAPSAALPAADHGAEPTNLEPQRFIDLNGDDLPDGRVLRARNRVAGPVEVECRLSDVVNMASDPQLPRRFILASLHEKEFSTVRQIDHSIPARYKLACNAIPGDPRAQDSGEVVYSRPFYPGTRFEVTQGFDGVFSHSDAESRYAVDLAVPDDTAVVAARDGVVMQVEEEFRASGTDLQRYASRANYVRVLHADGSMAVYAHLSPRSTIVKPGELVHTGDLLGKSGNTGFSTGPHLHFAVQRNSGMKLESIPFAMDGVTAPKR
ncbi:MAG: M23 family metallopeptidase [Tahibacter sp.]